MTTPFDIEDILEYPEDMPCCPLCNNPIMEYERIELVKSLGVIAVAHYVCCAQYKSQDQAKE